LKNCEVLTPNKANKMNECDEIVQGSNDDIGVVRNTNLNWRNMNKLVTGPSHMVDKTMELPSSLPLRQANEMIEENNIPVLSGHTIIDKGYI
jgi:hypothetical protein